MSPHYNVLPEAVCLLVNRVVYKHVSLLWLCTHKISEVLILLPF